MNSALRRTSGDEASLAAFRTVDFDWAARLQDVWRDPPCDVSGLHTTFRRDFSLTLAEMASSAESGETASPLGWVLVGRGGSGKTHLMGRVRSEAARQNAGFVLVDMTDVRDFWEILMMGFLNSLQQEYAEGRYQHVVLLEKFVDRVGADEAAGAAILALTERKSTNPRGDVNKVLSALARRHPRQTHKFADTLRALICLNLDDFELANAGLARLQGQELDDELHRSLGFQSRRQTPKNIVEALSWFMSLSGPSVVVFDQLDSIVNQHSQYGDDPSEEQNVSWEIIQGIGGGLGALPDVLSNTLCIVSCVESTWDLLRSRILGTSIDRYQEPYRLSPPADSELYEALIRGRLAPAYEKKDFTPPFPTWPFAREAIARLANVSFREVLKMCDAHRRRCHDAGAASELSEFGHKRRVVESEESNDGFAELDRLLETYSREASPIALLDEKHEDERLAPLYQAALRCLVHEHEERLPDGVDAVVERQFAGGRSTRPLHARLRFVFHDELGREEHYCVRALQRTHATAYQNRLKAATTQSGIDKALKFRHLVLIRSGDPPNGKVSRELTTKFHTDGGRFHRPDEQELRTLYALRKLEEENDPNFTSWLAARRPVTRLNLDEALAPGSPFSRKSAVEPPATDVPDPQRQDNPRKPAARKVLDPSPPEPPVANNAKVSRPDVESPVASDGPLLPLGNRIIMADRTGELVTLPLHMLTKHTMILGGSGSGKSVTVRRIVEEAALAGVPSIVVDCAQDMALFDEKWEQPQEHWREGDAERARRFHELVEQIVWTPGALSSGNPLCLRPLPDLSAVRNDREELHDAVMMISDGLRNIVAPGNSQKSQHKEGVLINSLKFFATEFPQTGLGGYVDMLSDLPAEAGVGIDDDKKLAAEMAASLKVEQVKNPLLGEEGSPLDPLVLFGDDAPRETVRVSVISLVKLAGDSAPKSFLNQLAMQLFAWIKENPKPPGNRFLRGLLVIDEARDFVPSRRTTVCKESMVRLAAQARKYRLGLVFATQHPKDVDTKIVGNCATHFYGLNNSPASLDTLRDLMAQKGGSGDDIPKLKTGQFYVHNADAWQQKPPTKIKVPMSLSLSPTNPLEESQILEKAERSRTRLERDD